MRTETYTFCAICGVHCSAKVTIEDGKIVKWEQDKESGFYYLPCQTFKGLANAEISAHPDRLKYPLKRAGARGEGKWQRISWDEALDTVATKFADIKEKYGPEYVGASVGEPRGFEFPWLQRFCTAFGTPNIRTPLAQCAGAVAAASSATYGPGHFLIGGWIGGGARDSRPEKLLIIWGTAGSEKSARERDRIRHLVAQGCKLVVIDPRRLPVTDKASLWIKPRPNTDPLLAMGLLKVIIEEGLYDKEFVEKWTIGFDKIEDEVKRFTLDDVEKVTWVSKEHILQIARWYGTIVPAVIRVGMGAFGQGWLGFQGSRVLDILRTIVGGKTLPGWGLKVKRVPTTPGGQLYLLDKFPRNIDTNLSKEHPYAVRSAYIADQDLINGILEDKIKAGFFVQCEPLITFANARKTYDAFMKIDFLVSANVFMTPTCCVSDIVLPVATINECDSVHTFTGTQPPHALPKIVDPPGEALSDVMIINGLAKKLGLGEYFFDSDVETINYLLGPTGLTWEDLKKRRFIENEFEEVPEEGGFFNTFSGKAELYSTRAKEIFECDPLPLWEELQPTYDVSEEYPLFGTSYEDHEYRLSAWKEVKTMRKYKPYPTVHLNPELAQKIGAKNGDWVWIESKLGRIMQKLVIDPELDPRVVMTTFGWYFPEDPANACQWDKGNINVLIPDEPAERSSGAVDTRGFPCRVYKAEESEVNLPPLDLTPGTPIVAAGKKTWD